MRYVELYKRASLDGPALREVSVKRIVVTTLIAAALFPLAAMPVVGQTPATVDDATWLAPASIPFDLAGDGPAPTGILRLAVAINGNFEPSVELATLDVTLNGDLLPTDLDEIYVTWESQFNANRDGTYDQDADEIELVTMTDMGGSDSFSPGPPFIGGPYTLTMTLPDNEITYQQSGNGYAYIFVAVDFANGVDTSKAVDIRVENITQGPYNAAGPPTVNGGWDQAGPFPGVATTVELDDYEVSVTGDASFLGGSTLAAPGSTVTALQLDFTIPDAELRPTGYVKLNSLTFNRVGTAVDADTAANGITVYADDDGTPGFSVGDTIYGTGTMTSGTAVVNLTTNDLILSSGNLTYYVAVDVTEAAVPTHTFGLQIAAPGNGTDVAFGDGLTDIAQDAFIAAQFGLPGNNQSFEYQQVGLVDPAALSEPGTAYTFEIEEADDTVAPSVVVTTPNDGDIEVSRSVVIQVAFSEGMDTIEESDVTISGSLSGPIDLTTDGTFEFNTSSRQSFTFTKDSPYEPLETVTVTVSGTVTDDSSNLNPMGTDYQFSFTTGDIVGQLSFTDIIVTNNQISADNAAMQIYVETPEGSEATDSVTIAVFTANGRRVATLTRAGETYEDVIARQPVVWDGTNDRGQALGPGLYFVQVSSDGYRNALRALIVR